MIQVLSGEKRLRATKIGQMDARASNSWAQSLGKVKVYVHTHPDLQLLS